MYERRSPASTCPREIDALKPVSTSPKRETTSLALSFQDLILTLHRYRAASSRARAAAHMEMGPDLSSVDRLARFGPAPWKAAYVQPSRQPTDGRYGENLNVPQPLLSISGGAVKPVLSTSSSSISAASRRSASIRQLPTSALSRMTGKARHWRLGPRLGSLVRRHGSHAVQSISSRSAVGLQAGVRRADLRPGATAMYIQGVDNALDLEIQRFLSTHGRSWKMKRSCRVTTSRSRTPRVLFDLFRKAAAENENCVPQQAADPGL